MRRICLLGHVSPLDAGCADTAVAVTIDNSSTAMLALARVFISCPVRKRVHSMVVEKPRSCLRCTVLMRSCTLRCVCVTFALPQAGALRHDPTGLEQASRAIPDAGTLDLSR